MAACHIGKRHKHRSSPSTCLNPVRCRSIDFIIDRFSLAFDACPIHNPNDPPPMAAHPAEITLRPFRISDAGSFFKWAGDDRVTTYCTWNTFSSVEQATEFLKTVILTHPWCRAICVGGDAVVGSVAVRPGSGKDQRKADIAYHLNKDYWGMGIATAAVKMAVRAAFEELKCLDRIQGLVFSENKASQKVLEKAGFLREGLFRKFLFIKGRSIDIVVYSLLNDE